MATQSYRERMKAARAAASAQRKAEMRAPATDRASMRSPQAGAGSGEGWHSGQRAEEAIDLQPGRADDDGQCADRALVHRAGAGPRSLNETQNICAIQKSPPIASFC